MLSKRVLRLRKFVENGITRWVYFGVHIFEIHDSFSEYTFFTMFLKAFYIKNLKFVVI